MIQNVVPKQDLIPMVLASVYLGRGTSRLRGCVVMLVLGGLLTRLGDLQSGPIVS